MIDGFTRAARCLAGHVLVRSQSAVWAHRGILSEDKLFDTRDLELRHERKVPAQCFAQGLHKGDAFTLFVSRMDRKHSAHFNKVGEGRTGWPVRVLLAIDVSFCRGHLAATLDRPNHLGGVRQMPTTPTVYVE